MTELRRSTSTGTSLFFAMLVVVLIWGMGGSPTPTSRSGSGLVLKPISDDGGVVICFRTQLLISSLARQEDRTMVWKKKQLVWACRMGVRRVMDVDGLESEVVKKRVQAVVLANNAIGVMNYI